MSEQPMPPQPGTESKPPPGIPAEKVASSRLRSVRELGDRLNKRLQLGTIEEESARAYDTVLAALPKDAQVRRQAVEKLKSIGVNVAKGMDFVATNLDTVWPVISFALARETPLASEISPYSSGRIIAAGIRGLSEAGERAIRLKALRTTDVDVPVGKGRVDEVVAAIIPKDYEVILDTGPGNTGGLPRQVVAVPRSISEGTLHFTLDPEPPKLGENQRLVGVGKPSA